MFDAKGRYTVIHLMELSYLRSWNYHTSDHLQFIFVTRVCINVISGSHGHLPLNKKKIIPHVEIVISLMQNRNTEDIDCSLIIVASLYLVHHIQFSRNRQFQY